jgi:hypothetical protein
MRTASSAMISMPCRVCGGKSNFPRRTSRSSNSALPRIPIWVVQVVPKNLAEVAVVQTQLAARKTSPGARGLHRHEFRGAAQPPLPRKAAAVGGEFPRRARPRPGGRALRGSQGFREPLGAAAIAARSQGWSSGDCSARARLCKKEHDQEKKNGRIEPPVLPVSICLTSIRAPGYGLGTFFGAGLAAGFEVFLFSSTPRRISVEASSALKGRPRTPC